MRCWRAAIDLGLASEWCARPLRRRARQSTAHTSNLVLCRLCAQLRFTTAHCGGCSWADRANALALTQVRLFSARNGRSVGPATCRSRRKQLNAARSTARHAGPRCPLSSKSSCARCRLPRCDRHSQSAAFCRQSDRRCFAGAPRGAPRFVIPSADGNEDDGAPRPHAERPVHRCIDSMVKRPRKFTKCAP